MKPKHLLLALVATTLAFTSCKKDDDTVAPTETEIETTFKLSSDQAIDDIFTDDAIEVMNVAAAEHNLTGNKGGDGTSTNNLICATVTVTPQSGFPKTVVIDFGTGTPPCTTPNGFTRSGKIIVVISDSLRHPNATSTMTFDNYKVNGYKKEGTIEWKNTSTPGIRSWRRTVTNGKVTAPGGIRWWLHNGVKEVVQTAGMGTMTPADDEVRISGSGTTTNSFGRVRSHQILPNDPLQKKFICHWIDKGKIRFEGPNHYAILDFGDGTCNALATISIDGQAPQTITLP